MNQGHHCRETHHHIRLRYHFRRGGLELDNCLHVDRVGLGYVISQRKHTIAHLSFISGNLAHVIVPRMRELVFNGLFHNPSTQLIIGHYFHPFKLFMQVSGPESKDLRIVHVLPFFTFIGIVMVSPAATFVVLGSTRF